MNSEKDRLSYTQMNSKVVDLCRNNVIKSIRCDAPCSEGYEVTNLTSSNFVIKSKGFLAERFIKPPINITLDFSSSVQLTYIVINCQVGAQKTMGLELLCKTPRTEGRFESIGSGVLPEDKIGFVFHRYSQSVTNSLGGQYLYKTFRSTRHLSFVDSFNIKIFRTNGCSVPAVGKLEVWGNPFKNTQSNNRIDDIKCLFTLSTPKDDANLQGTKIVPEPKGQQPYKPFLEVQHSTCNLLPTSKEDLQIPDEFIDPITCEIMSQPLIMPSGKIVDNSTLESYIQAEEKWGRGANDPFTGVLFTSLNKPIVASDLKIRIDKFLSKNSHSNELFGIPRTVGRSCSGSSEKIYKPSISNLVSFTSTSTSSPLVNLHKDSINTLKNHFGKPQPTAKRLKLEVSPSSETIISGSHITVSKYTNSRGKHLSSLYFQEMMDQSLEFSLKKTLSQLPKLTSAKVCKDTEQIILECHMCKLRNDLFSISCTHYICRNCLIKSKTRDMNSCQICNSQFKSSDAVKIHIPI